MSNFDSLGDFRKEIRSRIDEDRLNRAARTSAFMSGPQSPEDLAEAKRLAKLLGSPMASVLADVEKAQLAAKQRMFADPSFERDFPTLSRKLGRDFRFATMARDDLGNLKTTEGSLDWIGRSFELSAYNLSESLRATAGRYIKLPPTSEYKKRQFQELGAVAAERDADNWGVDAVNFLTSIAAIGGAGIAGFGVGGPIGSVTAAAGVSYALNSGEVYKELRDLGYTDQQAAPLADGWGAVMAALDLVGAGRVTSAFSSRIKGLLPGMLKRGLPLETRKRLFLGAVKDYAGDLGVETVTEVLQQAASIAARLQARSMHGGDFELDIGEELWSTLVHTARGMTLVGIPGAARNIYKSYRQAGRADQTAEAHQRLETLEAESKLRTLSPEDRADFVNEAAPEEVSTVYIRPDKLVEVVERLEQQPDTRDVREQLETSVPGVLQQAREAIENGTNVEVPIGVWQANLALSKVGRELMPHAVFHQDADTAAEREELIPIEDRLNEVAVAEAAKRAERDDEFREILSEVYDTYFKQAVAVGRPVAEARAFASLTRNTLVTLAKAEGVELAEYVQRENVLEVQKLDTAIGVTPDQLFDQDRLEQLPEDEDLPVPAPDTKPGTLVRSATFPNARGVFVGQSPSGSLWVAWRKNLGLEGKPLDPAQDVQSLEDWAASINTMTRRLAYLRAKMATPGLRKFDDRLNQDPDIPEPDVDLSYEGKAGRMATADKFRTRRDYKQAVQQLPATDAVLAMDEQELFDHAVKTGFRDAMFALQGNPNAVGWYDDRVQKAIRIFGLMHPEVLDQENNQPRLRFIWAVAVTSNGLKVDENFALADQAYRIWKRDKSFKKVKGQGTAKQQIEKGLQLYDRLRSEWGEERLLRFMLTKFKSSELNALVGEGLKPSGELADQEVYGASILGPKIGNGFFMNLFGVFDQLTMDRWLIRTWGRWTGTLFKDQPEQTVKARKDFIETLKGTTDDDVQRFLTGLNIDIAVPETDAEADALATALRKASTKKANRTDVMDLTDTGAAIRRGANKLWMYLDGQKEDPANKTERRDIRDVFQRILVRVRAEDPQYSNLTMADLQAALWYAEKRHYEDATVDTGDSEVEAYEDDEAPDYANAAASLARKSQVEESALAEVVQLVNDGERIDLVSNAWRPFYGEGGPALPMSDDDRFMFNAHQVLVSSRRAALTKAGYSHTPLSMADKKSRKRFREFSLEAADAVYEPGIHLRKRLSALRANPATVYEFTSKPSLAQGAQMGLVTHMYQLNQYTASIQRQYKQRSMPVASGRNFIGVDRKEWETRVSGDPEGRAYAATQATTFGFRISPEGELHHVLWKDPKDLFQLMDAAVRAGARYIRAMDAPVIQAAVAAGGVPVGWADEITSQLAFTPSVLDLGIFGAGGNPTHTTVGLVFMPDAEVMLPYIEGETVASIPTDYKLDNYFDEKRGGQVGLRLALRDYASRNEKPSAAEPLEFVVSHTMRSDVLQRIIDADLPLTAPSMGVTRANSPMSWPGDVRLVGSVDLASDHTYDSDVWSGRVPFKLTGAQQTLKSEALIREFLETGDTFKIVQQAIEEAITIPDARGWLMKVMPESAVVTPHRSEWEHLEPLERPRPWRGPTHKLVAPKTLEDTARFLAELRLHPEGYARGQGMDPSLFTELMIRIHRSMPLLAASLAEGEFKPRRLKPTPAMVEKAKPFQKLDPNVDALLTSDTSEVMSERLTVVRGFVNDLTRQVKENRREIDEDEGSMWLSPIDPATGVHGEPLTVEETPEGKFKVTLSPDSPFVHWDAPMFMEYNAWLEGIADADEAPPISKWLGADTIVEEFDSKDEAYEWVRSQGAYPMTPEEAKRYGPGSLHPDRVRTWKSAVKLFKDLYNESRKLINSGAFKDEVEVAMQDRIADPTPEVLKVLMENMDVRSAREDGVLHRLRKRSQDPAEIVPPEITPYTAKDTDVGDAGLLIKFTLTNLVRKLGGTTSWSELPADTQIDDALQHRWAELESMLRGPDRFGAKTSRTFGEFRRGEPIDADPETLLKVYRSSLTLDPDDPRAQEAGQTKPGSISDFANQRAAMGRRLANVAVASVARSLRSPVVSRHIQDNAQQLTRTLEVAVVEHLNEMHGVSKGKPSPAREAITSSEGRHAVALLSQLIDDLHLEQGLPGDASVTVDDLATIFSSVITPLSELDRLEPTNVTAHRERKQRELIADMERVAKRHPLLEGGYGPLAKLKTLAQLLGSNRVTFGDWSRDETGESETAYRLFADYLTNFRSAAEEYYEAKPLRNIDLKEFAGAVIDEYAMSSAPAHPSPELKKLIKGLTDRGLVVVIGDATAGAGTLDLLDGLDAHASQEQKKRRAENKARTVAEGTFSAAAQKAIKVSPREILFEESVDGDMTPRGRFIPRLNKILIDPERADSSTLFHELAHFYLEDLTRIAREQGERSAAWELLDPVLSWAGFTDKKQWLGWSVDQRRDVHEAFAMSFEKWLYSGTAPSEDLRDTFTKTRGWMAGVYTDVIKRINRNYAERFQKDMPGLTDEIKQVFGTMVATEADALAASDASDFEVLFESEAEFVAAGGTPDRYAELLADHARAEERAVDELTKKRLRQMELASGAMQGQLKKMQAEHNVRRREIRAEVEPRLKRAAHERVRSWLRNGEHLDANGDLVSTVGKNTGHKLNRGAVASRLGASEARKLDEAHALANNGLDPDVVATMFDYEGADPMLRALLDEPDLGDAIKREVDKRMRDEHPELTDPKTIREHVAEAVHNTVRKQIVAAELKLLDQDPKPARTLLKAAKNVAERKVRDMPVKQVSAYRFALAARRARKDARAAVKKGDLPAAREAKRRELMSEALTGVAAKFREERAKELKLWRKANKPDKRLSQTRDLNVIAVLRSFLATIDGLPGDPDSLLKRVSEYAPEVVESLTPRLNRARRLLLEKSGLRTKPTDKLIDLMSVDDFREVSVLAKELWHLSRKIREVRVGNQRMLREDAAKQAMEDLGDAVEAKPELGKEQAVTWIEEKVLGPVKDYWLQFRRVEHLFDKIGGIFPKLFQRVKDAALTKRNELRALAHEVELELGALDLPDNGTITADKLGYTFGKGKATAKAEVIGMALHFYGNESNRAKLLGGYGWEEAHVSEFLETMQDKGILTEADFQYIQRVYDRNQSLLTRAQQAHYEAYGFYFNTIEATPFETRYGTFPGGYVPAKVDPLKVGKATKHEIDERAEFMRTMPVYSRGFAQDRVEKYTEKLDFDIGNQVAHLDTVLNMIHLHSAVRDVTAIMSNPGVDAQIRRDLGQTVPETVIMPWLQRSVSQRIGAPRDGTIGKVVDWLARRSQMVIMFGNMVNALQNYTGFGPIAREVPMRYLSRAAGRYLTGGRKDMGLEARSMSLEMAERFERQIFETRDQINSFLVGDKPLQKVRRGAKWVSRQTYILQQVTQTHVDLIGFHAAHAYYLEQELAVDGATPEQAMKRATKRAEKLIRQTQMAGNPEDVATFESLGGLWRAVAPFKSWFINWINRLVTQHNLDMQKEGVDRVAAMMATYAYNVFVPAVLAALISEGLRGDLDADEDDEYLDDMPSFLARAHIDTIAGAFPVIGDALRVTANTYLDDDIWNNRMPVPPFLQLLEKIASRPAALFEDGAEFDEVVDVITLFGTLLGIPLEAFGMRAKFLAENEGGALETTRGLLGGR